MRTNKHLLVLPALAMLLSVPASGKSLWPENGASLFADNKAYRVGDIVTIEVDEDSSISSSAGQELSRATETDASINTFVIPTGRVSTTRFFKNKTPAIEMDSTRTFTGSGSYTLNDSVQTSISAVVMEVLPNGNLIVEGKRVRQSVDEVLTIHISGIVRPVDITTSNTVPSNSLAQAHITIESSGPVARSNKRGWFNRFIDIIWPL